MRSSSLASIAISASIPTALPSKFRSSEYRGVTHGITNSSEAVHDRHWDYVICGGGLTGLTVASRLTEDPNIHVLVIENGYDNHADPRVNDVRTYGQAFGSEVEYGFQSTPVKWQNNTSLLLVAGKTLGGSDSLNGASWTKGPRSQYDLLPVLTGDNSWGFDSFNKYMLKAENFHIPSDEELSKGASYIPEYHGVGGPVQVAYGAGMYGGTQLAALDASENLWNFTRNPDAASGQVAGSTIIPNMVHDDDNQNRSSAFTAYAQQQSQQRENFLILTGHRVTRIAWRDTKSRQKNLVAEGVHFQTSRDSPLQFVKAKREVLLAAGSLQSPQILELSEVGDPEILQPVGIDVKLPIKGVGRNMQEQTKNSLFYTPKSSIDFDGSGPPSAISFPTARELLRSDADAWYHNTTATLASHAQRLYDSGLVASAPAAHKILQAQLDNLFTTTDAAAAEVFFTVDLANKLIGIDNWNLIVLSRGTAHISTNNSWDHPIIEPSYFGHPLDLAFQTAANQQSREVYHTYPLSNYVTSETTPGLSVLPLNATRGDWEDWVKSSFTSVWHYIATLSMMKEEFGGVVDSKLKVYGIENVRAVDASVLPVQLSAHLSSSLFGIAEKAAEMIREDQKQVDG